MPAGKVSMQAYTKPPLSLQQQLDLLKDRGLVVTDEPRTLHLLATISYYRLSGYWFPMRQSSTSGDRLNEFKPNATFDQVVQLYEFDRELRALVLSAVERIEIAVRTQMTYHFGEAHGAFGHTDVNNFHPNFRHQPWLDGLEKEVVRAKDKFVQHYRERYSGFPRLPIWMATEVMSFGSLSYFYTGMTNEDKRTVASFFNLHYRRLQNWLHVITYIRNVCAHHSRLWNRDLAISPDQIREPNWSAPITPRNDRMFYVLLMIRHLLNAIGPIQPWRDSVNALASPVSQIPAYRVAMGMPEDWQNHPLWR